MFCNYLSSQSVVRLWFSNIFVIRSKKDNCFQDRAAIRRNDLWPFQQIERIRVTAPSFWKSSNYGRTNNQSRSLCIITIFLLTNKQGWFLTNLRILKKEHHDSCEKKKYIYILLLLLLLLLLIKFKKGRKKEGGGAWFLHTEYYVTRDYTEYSVTRDCACTN